MDMEKATPEPKKRLEGREKSEFFEAGLIEEQVKGFLNPLAKVEKITSLKIEGNGDEIILDTKLLAKIGLGFHAAQIQVIFENKGNTIGVKSYKISAGDPSSERIVRSNINSYFDNIATVVEAEAKKAGGGTVKEVGIENGKWKVVFEGPVEQETLNPETPDIPMEDSEKPTEETINNSPQPDNNEKEIGTRGVVEELSRIETELKSRTPKVGDALSKLEADIRSKKSGVENELRGIEEGIKSQRPNLEGKLRELDAGVRFTKERKRKLKRAEEIIAEETETTPTKSETAPVEIHNEVEKKPKTLESTTEKKKRVRKAISLIDEKLTKIDEELGKSKE